MVLGVKNDEKKKAKEINLKFATHGFLNNKDEETI